MSDEYEPPLITTRYSKDAVGIINIIYKNLSISAYFIVGLVIFSILDVLGILHLIGITSEFVHDIIVTLLLFILLAAFVIMFLYITRARKILLLWHDRFEESSLKASIDLLITDKSKEGVIYALGESIEEINPYIEQYREKQDIDRFIDVNINGLRFDILIDEYTADDGLKNVLKEYGSIIVRIVDGKADKSITDKFYKDLLDYNRIRGKRIGLALIIADEIKPIQIKHKSIDRILFIEKLYPLLDS